MEDEEKAKDQEQKTLSETDTISLIDINDQTLNKVDLSGVQFDSFTKEQFTSFLLSTFEKHGIKVYGKNEEIELGEELGKGAFGIVYKATMKDEVLAIKFLDTIDHKDEPEKTITTIINELKAITKVKHNKIPQFFGVFEKDDKIGLMFSFIQGVTLNIYLEKNKIPESEKVDLMIQLVEILVCLHEKRVIHRDVKPKNTMVTSEKKLILIDFGISRINDKTIGNTVTLKGSPAYSPPEAFHDLNISEDRTYAITTKFDVWSVGCVIMEMFSGEKPWSKKFKDSNRIMLALSKHIKFKGFDIPLPANFEKDHQEIFEVIKNSIVGDVSKRYTSKELLKKLFEVKEFFTKNNR